MKKRLLAVAFALVLVVSLCACGGPTPTETVDTFLTAVKAKDTETIKTVYAEETFDFTADIEIGDEEDEDAAAFTKVLEEELYPMAMEFEYTLSNEVIEKGKATVDVTIKTYAFGSAISTFMSNYTSQVIPMAFSGASNEEMYELAAKLLSTELGNLGDPSFEKTVTVTLTEGEEGWIIDELDEEGEFYNALTGNLVNTIENME